jgi:hypothetical protein
VSAKLVHVHTDETMSLGMWPPVGLLFIPQMMYKYRKPWWNDIDRGTEE